MNLKILASNALNFSLNRVIEIVGMAILITGILLLSSLITFSPDDPNFIFPSDTEITNILGFRGSFIADIFFQSFGLISLLIPFSIIASGINIIINKKIFLIIENIFYTILYSLLGSLFFTFFYPITFKFYINGNGGFVGKYLEKTFFNNRKYFLYYFIFFVWLFIFFLFLSNII